MADPAASAAEPQSADAVLMVRPAAFAANPQTASTNAFQRPGASGADDAGRALREFDGLAERLAGAGVEVVVADDTPVPRKPDAVFPNNWVSFHHDGTAVLYPMFAPNRRPERRLDLVEQVVRQGRRRLGRILDLSPREEDANYLEGTGSLVLDRSAHVAYACLSPRTHPHVLGEFAAAMGYETVVFEAFDRRGAAVYHTNVLMAIGTRWAVVCAAAITDAARRDTVLAALRDGGREVVEITLEQMSQFAANVLELACPAGPMVALSDTAWRGLQAAQRRRLERCAGIVTADIPGIEQRGGGGVRCMLAEIHLPRHA